MHAPEADALFARAILARPDEVETNINLECSRGAQHLLDCDDFKFSGLHMRKCRQVILDSREKSLPAH